MRIPYLLSLALLLLAQTLMAVAKDDPYQAKAADVRLVIDISGSMKRTDPQNLRIPSVELMCRLMPAGSRAGIWSFGQSVSQLSKLQDVDAAWKTQAIAASKTINSAGLLTNIGAALEKASADPGDDKHRKHIILLTDGMVDLGKDPAVNQAEWQRITNQILPDLKKRGFAVHTVALSDEADRDLLRKLSLATDGTAASARSADDLMKAFLQVFDSAAPAQQLPMAGNTFEVDDSVDEATALIFRADGATQLQLEAPDKTTFGADTAPKNVNWFRGDNYDLITFKQPAKGVWGIKGDIAPGSRVTVVSDLNLQVKPLPNNVFVGHLAELSLVLQEEGKTFINPEFLKLMKVTGELDLNVSDSDPKNLWTRELSGEKPPVDGVFHTDLPSLEKPGVYNFNVIADGKTFKREFRQRVAVRERFELDVEAVGDTAYELTIKTFDEDIDKSSVQFLALLEDDKHQKTPLELQQTPIENWRAEVQIANPGEYLIKVGVKGKTVGGEGFQYDLVSPPILHKVEAKAEVKSEPKPEPKPEPEPVAEEHKPEPAPPAEEEKASTPNWIMYVALGLANCLLIGGGFFLYKKLASGKSSDAILDEFSESKISAPPPPPPKPKAPPPPPPPMEEYDETVMQVPPTDEEEPPMEDLDAEVQTEGFDLSEPDESKPFFEMEPDVSADDIDALLAQQTKPAAPPAEEDDMVKAMLKAQGLDLAEHEMDDAITNLIDELDTAGARKDAENSKPAPDFDFDDFGLDDDK